MSSHEDLEREAQRRALALAVNMGPRELAHRVGLALEYARAYSQTDEGHHKAWTLDQMVRALTGCPVETVTEAAASFSVQGTSDEYRTFVREHNDGEDGPDTYSWDVGIAP